MTRKSKQSVGKQEAGQEHGARDAPEGTGPEPDNPGENLLSAEEWALLAERFGLSAREILVAVLIFEGKSRYQIGRQLRLASGTVRVYIDRLYKKLKVRDRVGLVLRLVRAHLRFDPPPGMSHKSAT